METAVFRNTRSPNRAELRRLLQDTDIVVGGRPPYARSIDCTVGSEGIILATRESSLRTAAGPVVTEHPVPLTDLQEALLTTIMETMTQALAKPLPAPAYTAAIALADESAHLESVGCHHRRPQIDTDQRIVATIRATTDGTIQGLRHLDDSVEILRQPGDMVSVGTALARVSASGEDRHACLDTLLISLQQHRFDGVSTNRELLVALLGHQAFRDGSYTGGLLSEVTPKVSALVVDRPGFQTTIQDAPGRVGYWEVGVPPSGPMDDLGLELANEVVGNSDGVAGIEITLGGFEAHVTRDVTIALGGAPTKATCDGKPIGWLEPATLKAGTQLVIPPPSQGMRTYLAIRGGVDTSVYLGSRSTFTLGGFGGFQGRELQAGDVLPLGPTKELPPPAPIPAARRPAFVKDWEIGVRIGPHTNPDFITAKGIEQFFAATWEVSPQSNRTGVRLLGPTPDWARNDGGEAGLHPSNLHDNAYAFGAIDLTGDLPVVLGPDGPSLGGFVCPGVVVSGQRWKLGQLKPGDTVRWRVVDSAEAGRLRTAPAATPQSCAIDAPVIIERAPLPDHPGRCLRRQGDEFMLLEFGPMELDLGLRLRVQALYERIRDAAVTGIIDLVPGIRSLQVHYNPDRVSETQLSKVLIGFDDELSSDDDIVLPSRTVHMPLSWDDPSTRKAIEIYMRTVNPDAPWCPWNIEFIRRINGLESVDQVQDIVFNADYLVYGLGDVYLGAPVATPLDPRHRLVTTKYNPARTWTPENAVGIGGAYLCIYGMEGPGGYQFVGRTVQVWNSYPAADCFAGGKPWLLRQFDRLNFYAVSADELVGLRRDFPTGRWQPRIEYGQISLAEQTAFAAEHAADIATTRERQQAAFAAERERWAGQGQETP